MRKHLAGLLLSFSLLLPEAARAFEPASFWEVRGEHAVAYLFGSLHICKADCYPLDKAIVDRFDTSPTLMVELDPNTSGAQQRLLEAAALPRGNTLSGELPEATRHALTAALNTLGLPSSLLERFRPWMAALVITTIAAEKQGYVADYGIDQWFLRRAHTTAKPVIELETIDRQIRALTAGSDKEQVAALHLTAKAISSGLLADQLGALIGAWRSGDLARLEALTAESFPQGSNLLQALITSRNEEMSARIDAQLKSGQSGFVTVGAAHMAGEEGLPALLKRRGYTVTTIQTGE